MLTQGMEPLGGSQSNGMLFDINNSPTLLKSSQSRSTGEEFDKQPNQWNKPLFGTLSNRQGIERGIVFQ